MRVVVIGAGIAGAAAAWHLAEHASVVMVEREAHPGAHATGRSAALHTETSGAPVVAALAAASRPFLAGPPEGFTDHGLLSPRGLLWIARARERDLLEDKAAAAEAAGVEVYRLDSAQCCELVGLLRPAAAAAGVYEPGAMTIDVDGLLQGFVRGARRKGAELHVAAEVTAVAEHAGGWRVQAGERHWDCDVVVNAAGAWCDPVAELAGVEPLGLRPLRRSVFVFPPPAGTNAAGWPMVWDIGNRFYFEPEGPLLLASPADETPSEPCDARPETDRHRAGRRGTGGGHHRAGSGRAPHLGRSAHLRGSTDVPAVGLRLRTIRASSGLPVRAATASRRPRLSGGWRLH